MTTNDRHEIIIRGLKEQRERIEKVGERVGIDHYLFCNTTLGGLNNALMAYKTKERKEGTLTKEEQLVVDEIEINIAMIGPEMIRAWEFTNEYHM